MFYVMKVTILKEELKDTAENIEGGLKNIQDWTGMRTAEQLLRAVNRKTLSILNAKVLDSGQQDMKC